MHQFEYKTVFYTSTVNSKIDNSIYMLPNPESEEDVLNELGKQGWELVSVVHTKPGINFYLKRKIS